MLSVTRQADYALRLMIAVAALPNREKISTASIAEQQNIPLPFLAKIVSHLSITGLLKTERGPYGGITLGRPVEAISMLEIIEAIDGPMALNTCVLDPDNCEYSASCPTCEVFIKVQIQLTTDLKKVTLAQLASRARVLRTQLGN